MFIIFHHVSSYFIIFHLQYHISIYHLSLILINKISTFRFDPWSVENPQTSQGQRPSRSWTTKALPGPSVHPWTSAKCRKSNGSIHFECQILLDPTSFHSKQYQRIIELNNYPEHWMVHTQNSWSLWNDQIVQFVFHSCHAERSAQNLWLRFESTYTLKKTLLIKL